MSEVDVGRYFQILPKWLWLIIISVAIAAGGSYYASQSMPATYRTSMTLMVGEDTANPNVKPDEMFTSQRLAQAYTAMVRRQPVLEATIESLGLQTTWLALRDQVIAINDGNSPVIELRVVGDDPLLVKSIAEEIARQLVLQSPTAWQMEQMEAHREFARKELNALQLDIQQAEAALTEKQAALEREVSARGVLDLQDEMKALELKLAGWRSSYATLLASYQNQTRGPNTLRVIEPAFTPIEPISPNVRANVLMAVAATLVLILGVLFLFEHAYGKVGSSLDIARVLALPTLGSIADMGRVANPTVGLITVRNPRSPVSEAYRLLRTNLQSACLDENTPILLVTSPGFREGKSITSANLAASFAQVGKRTVLVDADIRRPSIHSFFGISNRTGLTTLFEHEFPPSSDGSPEALGAWAKSRRSPEGTELLRSIEACLAPTELPTLRILPSGPMPANPADLLASSRMDQILTLLRGMADVVILDGPPVLSVADAGVLAGKVGGLLLVAEANGTRIREVSRAKEVLLHARGRILGVALNRTSRRPLRYYYRYYEAKPKRPTIRRPILRTTLAGHVTRPVLKALGFAWRAARAILASAVSLGIYLVFKWSALQLRALAVLLARLGALIARSFHRSILISGHLRFNILTYSHRLLGATARNSRGGDGRSAEID